MPSMPSSIFKFEEIRLELLLMHETQILQDHGVLLHPTVDL